MSTGALITVNWKIKPEATEAFIAKTAELFKTARLKPGFRNIRLLRGDIDKNEFILIEEWDKSQMWLDYVDYRTKSGEFEAYNAMLAAPAQFGMWDIDAIAAAEAEMV